jgi:predicted secreted protein
MLGLGTLVAIYFLIWWIVLFAVLPWGVHNQEESGEVTPGTDPGAPAIHRVWGKLLWTTLIASVVFAILYVLYARGLIPIEWLTKISTPPR